MILTVFHVHTRIRDYHNRIMSFVFGSFVEDQFEIFRPSVINGCERLLYRRAKDINMSKKLGGAARIFLSLFTYLYTWNG